MPIPLAAFGLPGLFASMFIDSYMTLMDRRYVPITTNGRLISAGRAAIDFLVSVRNTQSSIQHKTIEHSHNILLTKDNKIMTEQPLNMYGYSGDAYNSYKFKAYRCVIPDVETSNMNVVSVEETSAHGATPVPELKSSLENCIPSSDCRKMGKVENPVSNFLKEAGATLFKRVLGRTLGLLLLSSMRFNLKEANA